MKRVSSRYFGSLRVPAGHAGGPCLTMSEEAEMSRRNMLSC